MSVSQRLYNEAGVHEYATFTNVTDETIEFYPLENIGESEVPVYGNRAPAAYDPSSVLLPGAVVYKTGSDRHHADEHADVLCEQPRHLRRARRERLLHLPLVYVPPHTTVFYGVLSDACCRANY